MPFGTITTTESTFGSISGTIAGAVPGTLTGSVGVPGPQGPAGPGSTWGGIVGTLSAQTDLWSALGAKYDASNPNGFITSAALAPYLTSATASTTYYPLTGNPSGFITGSALTPYLTSATAASTYQTLAGMSSYLTTSAAASTYYPLSGNPSGFLTSSALTGYATQSFVAANYAPIAAGLPTGGTVGQVLTKNSGTDYDDSWQTLIPGDRYLTTSTTSNTIGNGAKTFTVGTGLSYSSQQDVVISYDAANHMHARVTSYDSGTGVLVVDVQNHTGAGTYASWTVNVGGMVPLQTVEWGEILGTLGDQTDLATALNAKLETSTAASTYAALAGATFTGEVVTPASTTSNAGLTITPGVAPTTPSNGEIWATTTDLQVRLNGVTETIAEQSWVTAQGYLTSAPVTSVAGRTGAITLAVGDVSGAAALAGATFTGLVNTAASTTTTAGLNIPHGTAPTTPVNGDIWTTTGNLWVRINGVSQAIALQGNSAQLSSNNTFTNASSTYGNSTAAGTINLGTGATISGATKTINIGTGGVAGSTTNINLGTTSGGGATITVSNNTTVNANLTTTGTASHISNSTATQTLNLAAGATLSGSTKTVNIGTSGVAGSTTAIAIGSTTGTSTTTLQGTTNGVTVAADTNSTALATTAYVVGQAGSATPLANGTAAVGTSLRYARQDHVHPTDTSRAPLASPALTGTPTAPTATAGTNTTQIATTAFVTAAVPTVATLTETRQFSNATKISPPLNEIWAIMSQDYIDIDRTNLTYTTTGTPQYNQVGSITTASRLNATVASSVIGRPFGPSQIDQVSPFLFRENWSSNINFNRKTYLSGRAGSFVLLTESTFNQAFYYGKVEGDAIGDLTRRGFGWRWSGGAGSRFVNLVVHNGTTQTTVQSSFAVTQEIAFDWDLYSDGAGNVTLYINGTQVATSNAGPTSYQSAGTYAWWREEVWTTGAPSFANSTGYFRGGRAAILNY